MNRSFGAQQETAMQTAALKQRQQLRASMMKEKEEELALFLEMRKREKEQSNLLLNHSSEDFDAALGSKPGTSPILNLSASTTTPARKTGAAADDFLNSDSDRNHYDWLLTPPGTPLFPSLEMESQKTVMSQIGTPKAQLTALKSRLANPQPDSAARGHLTPKQLALPPGLNSIGILRPSSSGGPGSRPSTPTGRPTLTGASKPMRSSTPTTRATLPSTKPSIPASKPVTSAAKPATKPVASTTKPTVSAARTASSATKPTVSARSSTPTRSTARYSTPTARPSIPSSKPVSRAATPTHRPSAPSSAPNISAPPIKSSPSVTKPTPAASRNSIPSRGASPMVESRPWKPSEMPGFSLDAPPNLRTTLPDRPLSATRGRPGVPSSRSSSVEPGPSGRPRRQSCSPSRGRCPNDAMLHVSGSSVPAVSRGYSKVSDNLSPVVIGNKMVERVINMRKLVPPKQDDKYSPHGNLSGKSASPNSSGFGRTLSKKSLDMAIRHMDIRRSIPGNLRPLMMNIPASSMYSIRSGLTQSRTISVSDSPLATSSNASSELSVNNNGICLDGSEMEDDIGSERGNNSPASVHAR
ncbi:nascent polypeptide-associated complex subunit alpha, muscle-specific form-like [Durio zibethinus]|uniref:Nascent polypeptide-associated complex subunit alpha, muscle-specific form-like n=1 Tax=Durio zibethinus TaxID=66656 RepID=A0A6P5YS34_DURZI|nr:nascent polypeptide-associated complex subunit alpha, muscle-specific form-like [Durio zibethinus]